MKVSLAKTVQTKLKLDSESTEFLRVYRLSLDYLTNGITAFQYQKAISKYMPADLSAKVFRLYLLKSRYLSLSLKLYVLKLSTIKVRDADAARRLGSTMNILSSDVSRIYSIWQTSLEFRQRIREWYNQLPKGTALCERELEKTFTEVIYPSVHKKIKAITYLKLRFIAKSSNLSLSDLSSELSIKAIQAYYKEVPSAKPVLHIVNYLNRAVANRATNMIYEATSKKKGRFICSKIDSNNERSFLLLEVSENQRGDKRLSNFENTFSLADTQTWAIDPTTAMDNEICAASLLDKYQAKGKKYKLLSILMGNVDPQFTTWLKHNRHCRAHEDNSDLQERLSVEMFQYLVSQYLQIDNSKITAFLSKIRNSIEKPTRQKTVIKEPNVDPLPKAMSIVSNYSERKPLHLTLRGFK